MDSVGCTVSSLFMKDVDRTCFYIEHRKDGFLGVGPRSVRNNNGKAFPLHGKGKAEA